MSRRVVAALLGIAMAALSSTAASAATFLALGDSYTIGEGVAVAERWPMQVADILRTQGVSIDTPEIVARTGWTTDELSAAMDAADLHPPFDLVTLLIGVNNQYRGRELDNYRNEFRALLERAIKLAGKRPAHVVVVSIPDWGVTRFGQTSGRDVDQVRREINAYNATNEKIAKMLHTGYADVTALSRDGADRADMLVGDGLHPSAAMYRLWAERIAASARTALSSP
jgi:lysophospholipase L1-like esterase